MRTFVLATVTTLIAFVGALAAASPATAETDGFYRDIFLNNRSSSRIVAFYASNVGRHAWNANILEGFQLNPGYRAHIDLNDGSGYCRFDFKTVFDDGTSVTERDVNVCNLSDYTIRD